MLRMIQQLSEALEKYFLGNNEGRPEEIELLINTVLKDVFKESSESISKKSSNELEKLLEKSNNPSDVSYLLGHLFYYKFLNFENTDHALKSIHFYKIWLKESQIYALAIIERIKNLKSKIE